MSTTPQDTTEHDATVRSYYDQWVTADTMSQCGDDAAEHAAISEMESLRGQIDKLLPLCSPAVQQEFANRGMYANGEPINVGQRDLSR